MMIHAYNDAYLSDAMNNLGEAFDYAVNCCNIDIDEFMNLFITSGFAEMFGKGNVKIISGLSGTELVLEVLKKANKEISLPEPQDKDYYSEEYWSGWIIAYYQWRTAISFKEINENISMSQVRNMYYPLHEASEEKFVVSLNAIIKRKNNPVKLKQQRKICGYTQKELAEKSGVKLRTLQQYESRAKDINKASVQVVKAMATALGCHIEDLLETELPETEQ